MSPEDCPRVPSLICDSVATPGVGDIKSSLGIPIHDLHVLYCVLHITHTGHEAWERDYHSELTLNMVHSVCGLSCPQNSSGRSPGGDVEMR